MDKQEISTFTDLYIKFQERCKHVANILSEYDCDFKESRWDDWQLDYDQNNIPTNCNMSVDIYARGCHVDSRTLHFPVELLSADDTEINEYAKEKYIIAGNIAAITKFLDL